MAIPTLEQKLRWLKPEPPGAWERECIASLRPGGYEIGAQQLDDILDEGMQTFERCCRTAFGVTGDSMVAILTVAGDVAAASCGTYLHTIIQPIIAKYIAARFGESPGIHDGDIWYTNDALYGGIHNPDRIALMPVFWDGRLLAWATACTHTTETGAIEPGGMPPSARSRFDEGLNLPPVKIGENGKLREDFLEMYSAFAIRAPAMVLTDLRARCTTADRVRVRLLDIVKKRGPEFLVGLLHRLVIEAEAGARARIRTWPDGTYRSVVFTDTIAKEPGLSRTVLTLTKKDDRLLFDFTGTSPETPTSYNLHPQAAVGHVAQYVYEYLFPDLPFSSSTFASIDFVFPPGSFLYPDARAATSNAPQIGPNLMVLSHSTFGKMLFATRDAGQVAASKAAAGNGHFLAGRNQWGLPFSDIMAYQLNTRGQGGRPAMDGMNAYGMVFCPFGRAPDTEFIENEFPVLVPLASHWTDSCGHGKYRGGVGTIQVLVAHRTPQLHFLCTGTNSKLQNAQPLFGGYGPPPTPGIAIRKSDLLERLAAGGRDLTLSLVDLLAPEKVGGDWRVSFRVRPTETYEAGDVVSFAFTVGGAGYGDPLERDPDLVLEDVANRIISPWVAEHVYRVSLNLAERTVDAEATQALRRQERDGRLRRGRPYAEFVREWAQKRPPAESLHWYGTWPDGKPVTSLVRP